MMKRAVRTVACLALLTTLGVACSDDDEDSDTTEAEVDETEAPEETEGPEETDAPAGGGQEFVIQGSQFPEGFTAAAGETFDVVNEDGFGHTVTSPDFRVSVGGGATEPLTVDAPGEYTIVCEIHSQMTGTITIT